MERHPVVRFEFGTAHGWYIGHPERWGLLPGDETSWSAQWQHYSETSGVGLADLAFPSGVSRAEFARDVGI